jgi:hypothetical protein
MATRSEEIGVPEHGASTDASSSKCRSANSLLNEEAYICSRRPMAGLMQTKRDQQTGDGNV